MASDSPEERVDPLQQALAIGVAVLERHDVRYALIGGLATGYRSRPRYTTDIDIIIDVPAVTLPGLLADLGWIQAEWQAIFPLDDPRMQWLVGQVGSAPPTG